jgi:uncharacterized membrane protein YoaK (UPF0700 family)
MGGISVHTTYLTGTITSLIGMRMALHGTAPIPIAAATTEAKVRMFCGIWVAFVVGSGIGAAMVLRFGTVGILGAALLLLAVMLGNSIVSGRTLSKTERQ